MSEQYTIKAPGGKNVRGNANLVTMLALINAEYDFAAPDAQFKQNDLTDVGQGGETVLVTLRKLPDDPRAEDFRKAVHDANSEANPNPDEDDNMNDTNPDAGFLVKDEDGTEKTERFSGAEIENRDSDLVYGTDLVFLTRPETGVGEWVEVSEIRAGGDDIAWTHKVLRGEEAEEEIEPDNDDDLVVDPPLEAAEPPPVVQPAPKLAPTTQEAVPPKVDPFVAPSAPTASAAPVQVKAPSAAPVAQPAVPSTASANPSGAASAGLGAVAIYARVNVTNTNITYLGGDAGSNAGGKPPTGGGGGTGGPSSPSEPIVVQPPGPVVPPGAPPVVPPVIPVPAPADTEPVIIAPPPKAKAVVTNTDTTDTDAAAKKDKFPWLPVLLTMLAAAAVIALLVWAWSCFGPSLGGGTSSDQSASVSASSLDDCATTVTARVGAPGTFRTVRDCDPSDGVADELVVWKKLSGPKSKDPTCYPAHMHTHAVVQVRSSCPELEVLARGPAVYELEE